MNLLEEIFLKFYKHFDGKLRWTNKKKKFTFAILDFFSNLGDEKENIRGEKEYLRLDYVWHFKTKSSHHLELAFEHENVCKIDDFLGKEIQHLIDVKAANKIAITYPSSGDESTLIEEIQKRIKSSRLRLSMPERYLIIFGFHTYRTVNGRKRRAIRFNAYYIEQDGEISKTEEHVILQGPRTFMLSVRAYAIGEDGVKRELKGVPFTIKRVTKKSV